MKMLLLLTLAFTSASSFAKQKKVKVIEHSSCKVSVINKEFSENVNLSHELIIKKLQEKKYIIDEDVLFDQRGTSNMGLEISVGVLNLRGQTSECQGGHGQCGSGPSTTESVIAAATIGLISAIDFFIPNDHSKSFSIKDLAVETHRYWDSKGLYSYREEFYNYIDDSDEELKRVNQTFKLIPTCRVL